MSVHPAPADPSGDPRYTSARYLALVAQGVLSPDDRVELLEGVIVAMLPQNPVLAAATGLVAEALRAAVAGRAAVREDKPLVLGGHSVPEPDVAVVPGRLANYLGAHPTSALLVVEVADSSLPQDRLTKARIYAAAAVPEYWIVNLRELRVEVFRDPDPALRGYRTFAAVDRDAWLDVQAVPDARVAAGSLLPDSIPDR